MSTNNDPKENSRIKELQGRSRQGAKFAIAGILVVGVLAAALTAAQLSSAMAQSSGNGAAGSNSNKIAPTAYYHGFDGGFTSTISTSGTATTKAQPDKVSIMVGVETNGTTAQEATSKNSGLMAKVIEALKGLGIKDEQIATSNFNVYPVYEYKQPTKICPQIYPLPPECQPGQVLTGYRASNSVTVTLDVGGSIDAGKAIDASVKSGANNISGVYFFISPDRQNVIRDNLTKDAISNARHRADVAASALGLQIAGVQSVNLNDVYFPVFSKSLDARAMEGGQVATPILPGEQEITTTVSIVFYFSNATGTSNTPPTTAGK